MNRQVVAGTGNFKKLYGRNAGNGENFLRNDLFFSEILEMTAIIVFYL